MLYNLEMKLAQIETNSCSVPPGSLSYFPDFWIFGYTLVMVSVI